jgi:hypothetical protein
VTPRGASSMAEQRTFNPLVQGSTPWRPTHLSGERAPRVLPRPASAAGPRRSRLFPDAIHSTSTMPRVNQYLHLHVLLHDLFKRALGRAAAKASDGMVTRTDGVNHCR